MLVPACRSVGETGGCPTIHGWIVSPTRVQIHTDISSPDDHLAAGPHYRTILSANRRIGGAGGRPTVGARIVPPAGVQNPGVIESTPDDHFTASPQCGVAAPSIRRVGCAGGSPGVFRAAT